jgi:hypothetical protein
MESSQSREVEIAAQVEEVLRIGETVSGSGAVEIASQAAEVLRTRETGCNRLMKIEQGVYSGGSLAGALIDKRDAGASGEGSPLKQHPGQNPG